MAKFGFHENLLFKSRESPAHIPEEGLYPFLSAPPSHVINLDAPPPKSNASLIAVRLVGVDRILTVDSHGIFHCFRYSWKADPRNAKDDVVFFNDESTLLAQKSAPDQSFDQGCFVAQRELPHFRSVPRLPHVPLSKRKRIAVALSKTLFASRTLLLALSDGDGRGGSLRFCFTIALHDFGNHRIPYRIYAALLLKSSFRFSYAIHRPGKGARERGVYRSMRS